MFKRALSVCDDDGNIKHSEPSRTAIILMNELIIYSDYSAVSFHILFRSGILCQYIGTDWKSVCYSADGLSTRCHESCH